MAALRGRPLSAAQPANADIALWSLEQSRGLLTQIKNLVKIVGKQLEEDWTKSRALRDTRRSHKELKTATAYPHCVLATYKVRL